MISACFTHLSVRFDFRSKFDLEDMKMVGKMVEFDFNIQNEKEKVNDFNVK